MKIDKKAEFSVCIAAKPGRAFPRFSLIVVEWRIQKQLPPSKQVSGGFSLKLRNDTEEKLSPYWPSNVPAESSNLSSYNFYCP